MANVGIPAGTEACGKHTVPVFFSEQPPDSEVTYADVRGGADRARLILVNGVPI